MIPDGLYDSIPMKVETMGVTRKSVKVADSKVYNTELIYSRVMNFRPCSSQDVYMFSVFIGALLKC